MFPLSPSAWGAIGVALLVAALGIAVKVQTARLDAKTAEYAAYQAQVEALGRIAAEAAKKREADDLQRKKAADDENTRTKRDLAGMYDAYRSLRDNKGAGSGLLPAAAAGAASPAAANFDRAGLDRTLSGFDRGVTGLLERGDQAIVDLNTAKAWAQDSRAK